MKGDNLSFFVTFAMPYKLATQFANANYTILSLNLNSLDEFFDTDLSEEVLGLGN